MKRFNAIVGLVAAPLAFTSVPNAAYAVNFDTLYIFGDSYSDTGSGFALTDGVTAASYLAGRFGSEVTLSDDPNPGTKSINFAESGARVGVQSPTGPTSLTNQVGNLVSLVNSGAAMFDPEDTLFFLSGGLNDHERAPASEVVQFYRDQVAELIGIGARYIQIAQLPREIGAFTDSADFLNPAYFDLVDELSATYSRQSITTSNWGTFYDDILLNPGDYGITDVMNACVGFGPSAPPPCDNPEEHFFYFSAHPSDAAHRIAGEFMYGQSLAIREVQAVPLPATLSLLGASVLMLVGSRRRRKPAVV